MILFIAFIDQVKAQSLPENIKDIDHKILNNHIITELNMLRKKKLINDTGLKNAAKTMLNIYLAKKTSLISKQKRLKEIQSLQRE